MNFFISGILLFTLTLLISSNIENGVKTEVKERRSYTANFPDNTVIVNDSEISDGSISVNQIDLPTTSDVKKILVEKHGKYQWVERIIDQDITLNVPTDYTDINMALDYLNDKTIMPNATVTIKVSDGVYNYSGPISIDHSDGMNVQIIGNVSSPSLVVLNCSDSCFSIQDNKRVGFIDGMTLVGSSSSWTFGIRTQGHSWANIGNNIIIYDFHIGIGVENNSYALIGEAEVYSNVYQGIRVNGSSVVTSSANVRDNHDIGYSAIRHSVITLTDTARSINNTTSGVRADIGSAIYADNPGTVISGNGTNFSPLKDSEGNNESYIR